MTLINEPNPVEWTAAQDGADNPRRGGATTVRGAPRQAGIDLVRAIALLRVVTYHAVGLPAAMTWFASMPLMFFIAGRFMESSLDREAPTKCVRRRFVRVLVPLAPYAVLILVVYWRAGLAGEVRAHNVISYFLPLFSFPGPTGPVAPDGPLGWTFIGLWYLQNYLLFVLVSPLLRRGLRQAPRLVAAGLGLVWITALTVNVAGRLVTFLIAWTVGMAAAVSPSLLERRRACGGLAGASLLVGSAVFFAMMTADQSTTPGRWAVVSVTLLGTGWVCASVSLSAQLDAAAAHRKVAPAIGWLNSRAVSVYLWHFPSYAMAGMAVQRILGTTSGIPAATASWILTLALTFVLATLTGGLEDIAGRRRVRLFPGLVG